MSALRSAAVVAVLSLAACVDFGGALEDCAEQGRCGESPHGAGGGAGGPNDSGSGGGSGAGGGQGDGAVCVDTDGDGLGPGCAQDDCEPNDGQRPIQFPCREGAHVCRTCPGASDQNTGSPSSPLLTIAQGMVHARALGTEVRVATRDRYRETVYDEDLVITNGDAIVGSWFVEDGGWGHPSAVPTVLRPTRLEGVVFSPGLGRATRLENFRVQPTRDGGVAITVRGSSPTLKDIEVLDFAAPFPTTTAVRVESLDGGARANPLLIDPVLTGGSGTTLSIGVHSVNSSVEIRGGKISGGVVGNSGTATGVRLENSPFSRISGAELSGCEYVPSFVTGTTFCRAVHATGDVAGIVVEGSHVSGCTKGCPNQGEFVGIDAWCTSGWDGGARLEIAGNTDLHGARGNANSGYSRAVRIFDGCGAYIHDNRLIVAADITTQTPFGVRCSRGVGQPESHCTIARNVIVSHSGGSPIDASAISCVGGCDEVVENELDSLGTSYFHTLHVEFGAPLVARNKINFNQTAHCLGGRSVLLTNTNARFENNFVRGPTCQNSIGVVHKVTTSGWGALVHSNTITGGDSTSTAAAFGIYAQGPAGTPSGRYWNNILSSGPAPSAPRSAICFEAAATPVEVKANLLHSEVVGAGVHTVLGYGTASPTYLNVLQTNMQSWGAENVDAVESPGVVGWRDFHLLGTSKAIDAGTRRGGGPSVDYDGDPRPAEDAGYSPAIGADQP